MNRLIISFIYIISILTLSFLDGISQNITNYNLTNHPDSIIQWFWDNEQFAWHAHSKLAYTYYNDSELKSEIYSLKVESEWLFMNNTIYAYIDNMLDQETSRVWDGFYNEWLNEYNLKYSYNDHDLLSNILKSEWHYDDIAWGNDSLFTYSYNANGELIDVLHQHWINNSSWENIFKFHFHDGNEGLSHLEYKAIWDFDLLIWEDIIKNEKNFDFEYNLEEQKQEIKILSQNKWLNDFRVKYKQNSKGLLESETHYTWLENPELWFEDFQLMYVYNEDNSLYRIYNNLYDWDHLTFEEYKMEEYTYDASQRLKDATEYSYKQSNWVPLERIEYYYEFETKITSNLGLINFKVFPNPTRNYINITFGNKQLQSIRIYNLIGELVFTDVIPCYRSVKTIDLSFIGKGVYVMHANVEGVDITTKVIIE